MLNWIFRMVHFYNSVWITKIAHSLGHNTMIHCPGTEQVSENFYFTRYWNFLTQTIPCSSRHYLSDQVKTFWLQVKKRKINVNIFSLAPLIAFYNNSNTWKILLFNLLRRFWFKITIIGYLLTTFTKNKEKTNVKQ